MSETLLNMKTLSKELHAPVTSKYPVRKIYVSGIDDTWAADLVDMSEWATSNDGFKWMLNIVDVFSRYAWAISIRNKTAAVVLEALQSVISSSGRKPKKIWWDEGGEFVNAKMNAYLKKEKIIGYHTYGTHGSVMVERFNRTLKGRMWRRFTEENTRRWVDMLPQLLEEYNNTKHRSIKMTPTQASDPKKEKALLSLQYKDVRNHLSPPETPPKFALGDWVRISREKGHFEKGYLPNWSREIFKVISILHTNPRVYEINDFLGERIKGAFYEQNLQKTTEGPTGDFLVEKVLDTKIEKGTKYLLVKWLGYNKSFNRWIPEAAVTRVFDKDVQVKVPVKEKKKKGPKPGFLLKEPKAIPVPQALHRSPREQILPVLHDQVRNRDRLLRKPPLSSVDEALPLHRPPREQVLPVLHDQVRNRDRLLRKPPLPSVDEALPLRRSIRENALSARRR